MSQPTATRRPAVFPDLAVQARWLHPLTWPCVLLPHGAPGILLVEWSDEAGELHGASYAVTCIGRGYRKRAQTVEVDGFRLLTPEGEVYDINPTGNGGSPSCDCGDADFRPRRGGCKHVAGLRCVGGLSAIGS